MLPSTHGDDQSVYVLIQQQKQKATSSLWRGFLKKAENTYGKNIEKTETKQHKWLVAGVVLAVIVFCVAIVLMVLAHFGILPLNHPNASESFVSNAEIKIDETEQLGYDLELQGIGSYAGLYLEDGSNDSVSDILMIRIKNTGEKDLRLARLSLTYSEFTAEFEITDLPAGRTVMVLEKNRHSYTDESYLSIALTDIVFLISKWMSPGRSMSFPGCPVQSTFEIVPVRISPVIFMFITSTSPMMSCMAASRSG